MIPLAWIDLETTGLEPEWGEVLEVACVVTDEHLQEVARFHRLIRPTDGAWDRMDSFVQSMHSASGLWREAHEEGGLSERVMDDLAVFLASHLQGERYLTVAGSNPGFDQRWLRVKAPHLDEVLSRRRGFDVNTLGILLGEHRGKARPHRAMPDLERDLALARKAFRLVEAALPTAPDPAPSPF